MSRDYLSVSETAKLIRAALKRNFPGTTFGVRSKSYSGGASVRVAWVNGPASIKVDAVAQRFHGAEFDGMTDSKSYNRDLLVAADGTMREVHFGADFVFCHRDHSPELKAAYLAGLRKTYAGTSGWHAWQYERECLRIMRCALSHTDVPAGADFATLATESIRRYFAGEFVS